MAKMYTENSIFKLNDVNALIDLIYSKMEIDFPPVLPSDPDNDRVRKAFVLSGQASATMQGAYSDPILNIAFEVSDLELFEWLQKNLADITKGRVVKFSNTTFLYKDDLYYEFWKAPSVKAKILENIFIQDLTFIAPNLL